MHGSIAKRLSAKDLRLCVGARNNLAQEMVYFVEAVLKLTPSAACGTAERCTAALFDVCADVELNLLGECNVLDSCEEAIETYAVDFNFCPVYGIEMLDREIAEEGLSAITRSIGGCGFAGGVQLRYTSVYSPRPLYERTLF